MVRAPGSHHNWEEGQTPGKEAIHSTAPTKAAMVH
jgi:hypothetical protein